MPPPTHATCPSGRIDTAAGAVTAPRTASSHAPARERVYTYFDVSPRTETGKAKLEVVVNGVASTPVSITLE